MPNMYARGILFGSMILELGDTSVAVNERLGMSCSVEFKTKAGLFSLSPFTFLILKQGYFSGTYNAIAGRVRKGNTDLGEISGKWSHEMYYTDLKV